MFLQLQKQEAVLQQQISVAATLELWLVTTINSEVANGCPLFFLSFFFLLLRMFQCLITHACFHLCALPRALIDLACGLQLSLGKI